MLRHSSLSLQEVISLFRLRPDNKVVTTPDKTTLAFTTYLASLTLAQNGWHIVMLPGVDPLGLTDSTSHCPHWASNDCPDNHNLDCSGYDSYVQCRNSQWWYSSTQNAAYTLSHDYNTDSTSIINDLLARSWATGFSLFELATICEVQYAIHSTTYYTTYNGKAGIVYLGELLPLQGNDATHFSKGTSFLPFNGSALSKLSDDPIIAPSLVHPQTDDDYGLGVIWTDYLSQGFTFNCLSQLNVTIANDWTSFIGGDTT